MNWRRQFIHHYFCRTSSQRVTSSCKTFEKLWSSQPWTRIVVVTNYFWIAEKCHPQSSFKKKHTSFTWHPNDTYSIHLKSFSIRSHYGVGWVSKSNNIWGKVSFLILNCAFILCKSVRLCSQISISLTFQSYLVNYFLSDMMVTYCLIYYSRFKNAHFIDSCIPLFKGDSRHHYYLPFQMPPLLPFWSKFIPMI